LPHACSLATLCASAESLAFSFSATSTTEIYTLSLHDALPISAGIFGLFAAPAMLLGLQDGTRAVMVAGAWLAGGYLVYRVIRRRSEEHTSELQSRENLVCRLLLEKKKSETALEVDGKRTHQSS